MVVTLLQFIKVKSPIETMNDDIIMFCNDKQKLNASETI